MDSSVCAAEGSPSPPSLDKLGLNDDDNEGGEMNKTEEEEEEDWSESESELEAEAEPEPEPYDFDPQYVRVITLDNIDTISHDDDESETKSDGGTPELWDRYYKQVQESEGFDVDRYPGMGKERHGFISPRHDPEDELWTQSTQFAIEHYNKKKGGQLMLSKVVRVNLQYDPYMPLYITFEAKDTADGRTRTYQAVTEMVPGEGERIIMFRPKPGSTVSA